MRSRYLLYMRDHDLPRYFGVVIRRLRAEAHMSQEAFADRCLLHRTYVGSIERGEKIVTIMTAQKLAKALDIRLSQLFVLVEKELSEYDIRGGNNQL